MEKCAVVGQSNSPASLAGVCKRCNAPLDVTLQIGGKSASMPIACVCRGGAEGHKPLPMSETGRTNVVECVFAWCVLGVQESRSMARCEADLIRKFDRRTRHADGGGQLGCIRTLMRFAHLSEQLKW